MENNELQQIYNWASKMEKETYRKAYYFGENHDFLLGESNAYQDIMIYLTKNFPIDNPTNP